MPAGAGTVTPHPHHDPYAITVLRTGLPFFFTLCTSFVLGFVLTFYGYLMGQNHKGGVAFLVLVPYFTVFVGYIDDSYPDMDLPNLPNVTKLYIYAVVAALIVALCIAFCKKVAIYLAGIVMGAVLAELIMQEVFVQLSCIENTGLVGHILATCVTYALCIAVCTFLMAHGLWSEYAGTLLSSIAGGLIIAWGVNFATLIFHHTSWINMGFFDFLDGLTRKSYKDHSEEHQANIFFTVWIASALLGFAWQIGEIRLHRDDGQNFIASDYEHIDEPHHRSNMAY
eukprot:GEMP01016210.1.p1 GENE.GEMP01016210.1~~GEMP01016210.1.p1  ORF type:complete len:283 (+),score=41.18 GEMP01016210.1:113-961(+)